MSTVMAEVAVCEEATRPACEPARTADLDDDPEDEGKQPVKPTQQVSAQNTDAQAIDQDNDDERRRLATDTKQPSSAAPSDSQSSRSSSRSKSDNCSSEATTASGKADDSDSGALSARRQSTTSRFKEKRPEPLKLNSNLNQDIPLDLSVKSAGVMPSGTLSSIFNLGGPFNPFAPLETPRIQWQDNCDSLLNSAKSRLFSSSTTASSNRARVSSIMGESPPITPNSGDPLMGAMFSSATNTSLRLPSDPPHSASLALESPLHSFLTSPFDLNSKLQLLDRLTQQPASGKHNYMLDQVRADLRGTPRRSCSTDNLQMFVNNHQTIASLLSPNQIQVRVKHDHHDKQSPSYNATLSSHTGSSKKNSISPLATKSLSNRSGSGGGGGEVCSPTTKFPYTSHQANTNTNDSQSSPTSNGKSLTPTSVTNATLNLYNIHLNSPNSNSRQSPIQNNNTTTINRQNTSGQVEYKSPSFSNFDHLDLFQNQVSVRRNASSSSSNGFDHISGRQQIKQHYQRQQSNPSISSTATLNTPTLISPSQLKAGQLCFLPSPTLSPMSSVFDLPSPLLMFAPSSSSAQASNQQLAVGEMNKSVSLSKTSSQNLSQQSAAKCADTTKKVKYDARQADKNLSLRQDNNRTARGFPTNCTSDAANNHLSNSNEDCFEASATVSTASRNNLSQLITSAEHKTPANAAGKFGDQDNEDLNHDIEMDIINEPAAGDTPRTQTAIGCEPSGNQIETDDAERPSTVIPQICISDHQRGPYDLQENQPQHLASAQAKLGKTSHATNNLLNQLDCMNNGKHSREQRAQLCKRSLSPKTFHARVKNYQNERLESCSAPPDVQQRRRRSKIKTAADSCFELGNGDGTDKTSRLFVDAPSYAHENNRNGLSHSAADLVHSQQDGRLDRPGNGMETRGWLTASNQQLDARSGTTAELSCGENPFLSGRSSSAEPAVFSEANTFSNSTHLEAHNSGNGIAAVIPSCQSAGQLYMSGVQANSTCSPHYQNQQVHIHHHHHQQQQQSHQQQQPSHTLQSNDNHSRSSYNQPHHHQQQYHSLANQQFQYQQLSSQALNYEQQTTYNAHQLYSMSASELHRLHYSSRGPTQAQAALANKNESTPFAQQSIPHYGQSFSHQNVQLPSDGHSGNHRVCANRQFVQDPDRSHDHAGPASHSANSSIIRRQMSLQPMAAQLLNRSFESCGANQLSSQQEMSARKGLIEPINGLAPIGGHQGGQMRVYHQPEVESRSESRSSCSLDFVGSFAGSNSSRSNSAAGSNLAAKKYHCDQCSKSFTRSDMLTRHRRLHSGDRPFQCTECKQEFSRSDHLSTHMRTHTGEKPYKCKLCTYSACRKDMITRHLKVHNRSGAETGRSYMS